jgi:3-methyladenine DNA glycosylase/8-oxoguanine DNA glycosylase
MQRSIDPEAAIAYLRAADPVMARLIDTTGEFAMRRDGEAPFRSLARAIVYQQLSGKAAGTIFGRFLTLFARSDGFDADLRRTDPSGRR